MTTDALFPSPPAIPVADTIRSGIEQQPARCWIVVNPDGTPNLTLFGDGDVPHFNTMTGAVNAYAAIETDDKGGFPEVRPAQLDESCWTATAACGYRYDIDYDDGPGLIHFDTRDEAAEAVVDAKWRIRDGALLCPPGHCEETP